MTFRKFMAGYSLKFRLFALTLGITFSLGAASLVILSYIIKTQEEARLISFEANAQGLSNAISAQFFERYRDAQIFSSNSGLRVSKRQTIVETLNNYVQESGIYDLILIVDRKGRLVAVNSKLPNGKDAASASLYLQNYSDTPWFKNVMDKQFTEDPAKNLTGTYFEDLHIDPYTTSISGGNRLGTSFSAAIRDEAGNVMGVLSNRAGAQWLEGTFRDLYEELKAGGYPTALLTLISKDGTLLFEFSGESKYDWNQLLKYNLATNGSHAAQEVVAGRSGHCIQVNKRSKIEQFTGYSRVKTPKFIEKIGWGVLVRDDPAEAMATLNHAKTLFYSLVSIAMILAALGSYFFSFSLSERLGTLASHLSGRSNEMFSAARQISGSSNELSEAAAEQASAIQETAASIDEVSVMLKKSADNASDSQKVSQTSLNVATQGQQAVQEMIQSIRDISQSNSDIMQQVEEGNRQISEIVKVIAEIGNKTKVINDIVFQTKLLSFNASVEAARAGEHGKGFAVVAEEVGKLAQMSGNAAKEISTMLAQSIQKVEGIVEDSQRKIQKLTTENKLKVAAGTGTAEKCGETLRNIKTTVEQVDTLVKEISAASHEQAEGVAEINKAMNQLDQVTQKNSGISQQAANSAENLSSQAEQLRVMVQDLFSLIYGKLTSTMTVETRVAQRENPPTVPDKFKPSPVPAPVKKIPGLANGDYPSKDDPRFKDV